MAVSQPNIGDSMITNEEVDAIISQALEALNQELDPGNQIEMSSTTPLFGVDAKIDSLGFVTFITDIETALDVDYGLVISLPSDRAMYTTTEALRDHIMGLVAGQ